jgi:arginyl-tRNA synthetase
MLIFEEFLEWHKSTISNLFSGVDLSDIVFNFDYNENTTRLDFGDLSTNIALLLSKKLKKNPYEIAELIKQNVQQHPAVEKIIIAGSGFINIYCNDSFYKEYYNKLLQNNTAFYKKITSEKKYNIEFVSANPTGPLHIGHGRGAIIGDVCAKVLLLKGYLVATEYYINDAGNQIDNLGKSLYAQYAALCELEYSFPENGYQGEYIVDLAKNLYKKNNNTLLQNDIHWFSDYGKNILLEKIKNTLFDYQIEFSLWFSEKKLHDDFSIDKAVSILANKGYVYTCLEGAIWFKSTLFGDEKDRVLKKSDGAWTYTAADIAYFLNKIERGFTDIVMVLGQDHHSFKIRMQAIAKAFGVHDCNLHIILYQLVTLKNEGEIIRMSKRKGNSIELQHIIDTVGSDVARFFYLQRKADAHLDFDLKEALEKSNKNPVFYIQYALVRIKSILEKANQYIDIDDYSRSIHGASMNDHEKMILRKIALFDSILDQICKTFYPHVLTYYTLELASLFHYFYTMYPIIGEDKNISGYRVGLSYLIKEVLEKCVTLLGISIPERM